jgi:predicted TIM-barrel fold metal-dependent hydrolase
MSDDNRLAGVCDCHVHVVGPIELFAQSATRSYTAQVAPLDSLRALAEPEGVSRFVIVQASFYGTDNSCLLEALDRLGPNGRSVVAVNVDRTTPGLLAQYEQRGVRGLRVNLYSKSLAFEPEKISDLVAATIEKTPSQGWHVEIIAPISLLLAAAKTIAASRVPIVLDHYALPAGASPDSPEGRRLLDLIALPHVWVKLTAPYRILADPVATRPPTSWLSALSQKAPDRCVWGSDWPHTPVERDQKGPDESAPYRRIRYEHLLGGFRAELPDPGLAARILVDNPARLYGFPSS